MVAPVVLVQDLTKGPYQAGVAPCAGNARLTTSGTNLWSFAILMNDKPGSVTPVLGNQFNGRSFSVTWAEIQNLGGDVTGMDNLLLRLATRSDVVAAGVPSGSNNLISIQNNDGTRVVPVEIFEFDSAFIVGSDFWRGVLGDNINVLGGTRTFDPDPNITLGPEDALVFTTGTAPVGSPFDVQMNIRGFYQEQPS